MSATTTIFGSALRAARLGYGRFSGGWLRLSEGPRESIRADLAPACEVPGNNSRGSYRCWWEDMSEAELRDLSPALRSIKAIRKPFSVLLSNAGTVTPEE